METQGRTDPVTGKEGAVIELDLAAAWTKNHRESHPYGSISQLFGIEIVQRLLQQPGCLGMRVYYSNSQKLNGWQRFILAIANFLRKSVAGAVGQDHFILVGVSSQGMDLLPVNGMVTGQQAAGDMILAAPTPNIVVEQAHPCPGSANCPKNVLTGD